MKSNATFSWGPDEEASYTALIQIINDPTTLQPFNKERNTHYASDASETGIQASIYQEVPQATHNPPTWVPIDHVSRTLTETESRYSPIERESLGLAWGMEQFRHYLVGTKFLAWTDHEPLPSIYNNPKKWHHEE